MHNGLLIGWTIVKRSWRNPQTQCSYKLPKYVVQSCQLTPVCKKWCQQWSIYKNKTQTYGLTDLVKPHMSLLQIVNITIDTNVPKQSFVASHTVSYLKIIMHKSSSQTIVGYVSYPLFKHVLPLALVNIHKALFIRNPLQSRKSVICISYDHIT